MSEKAFSLLEAVRREMLELQQVCSYCGKTCKNADHLYLHILLRHQS